MAPQLARWATAVLAVLVAGVFLLAASSTAMADDEPNALSNPTSTRVQVPVNGEVVGELHLQSGDVTYPVIDQIVQDGVLRATLPLVEDGKYELVWVDSAGEHHQELVFGGGIGEPIPQWHPATGASALLWVGLAVALVGLTIAGALLVRRRTRRAMLVLLASAGVGAAIVGASLLSASPTQAVSLADCSKPEGADSTCLAGYLLTQYDLGGVSKMRAAMVSVDQDDRFLERLGVHPCHEAGHLAGRRMVQMGVDVDPVIASENGECQLGLMHGVVEELGRVGTLEELTSRAPVCSERWKAQDGDEGRLREECVHGFGHALVFRYGGDGLRAMSDCVKVFPDEIDSGLCVQGVGMTVAARITILGPSGLPLGELLPEDAEHSPARLCERFEGLAEGRCYDTVLSYLDEQLARALDLEPGARYPAIVDYCAALPDRESTWHCLHGVGSGMLIPSPGVDLVEAAKVCAPITHEADRIACAAGVVHKYQGQGGGMPTDEQLEGVCAVMRTTDRQWCTLAVHPMGARDLAGVLAQGPG